VKNKSSASEKNQFGGTSSGKKKSQDARELLADDVMIQIYIAYTYVYTGYIYIWSLCSN